MLQCLLWLYSPILDWQAMLQLSQAKVVPGCERRGTALCCLCSPSAVLSCSCPFGHIPLRTFSCHYSLQATASQPARSQLWLNMCCVFKNLLAAVNFFRDVYTRKKLAKLIMTNDSLNPLTSKLCLGIKTRNEIACHIILYF